MSHGKGQAGSFTAEGAALPVLPKGEDSATARSRRTQVRRARTSTAAPNSAAEGAAGAVGEAAELASLARGAPEPAEAADDEAQLGAAVGRLCFVLPRGVKDLCQSLQPVLRTVADLLQQVHDIFTNRHAASPAVAVVLVALAWLASMVSFATTV